MTTLYEGAFAKINLTLDVLDKRPDGYHDIQSVMQTISIRDDVQIDVDTDKPWTLSCDQEGVPTDERNLAWKAAKVYCDALHKDPDGIEIRITKRIPSGAGMGGGSSDAAGMLQGLQKLFEVSMTDADLKEAAETIGSDVPFFLYNGADYDAAIVTGRGENVKYIEARRDLYYVLVCPGVHSSTKEAYDLVDNWNNGDCTTFPTLSDLESVYKSPVENWTFCNSFTKPIAWKYPEVQQALQDMENCNPNFAEMTGSGSVVFGIFSSEIDAKKAYTQLCQNWKKSYFIGAN